MNDSSVDVRALMDEIRAEAADTAMRDPVSFESAAVAFLGALEPYSPDALEEAALQRKTAALPRQREARTDGGVKAQVKKLLERLVTPSLAHFEEDVCAADRAALRLETLLASFVRDQERQNEAYRSSIRRLESRVSELEQQLSGMQRND